jgi:hypothetical protein
VILIDVRKWPVDLKRVAAGHDSVLLPRSSSGSLRHIIRNRTMEPQQQSPFALRKRFFLGTAHQRIEVFPITVPPSSSAATFALYC